MPDGETQARSLRRRRFNGQRCQTHQALPKATTHDQLKPRQPTHPTALSRRQLGELAHSQLKLELERRNHLQGSSDSLPSLGSPLSSLNRGTYKRVDLGRPHLDTNASIVSLIASSTSNPSYLWSAWQHILCVRPCGSRPLRAALLTAAGAQTTRKRTPSRRSNSRRCWADPATPSPWTCRRSRSCTSSTLAASRRNIRTKSDLVEIDHMLEQMQGFPGTNIRILGGGFYVLAVKHARIRTFHQLMLCSPSFVEGILRVETPPGPLCCRSSLSLARTPRPQAHCAHSQRPAVVRYPRALKSQRSTDDRR